MGAKIVFDIHDIVPEFYCQKFGQSMRSPLARALRLIEKLSVHFADHVIIANHMWKSKVISRDKLPAQKITTILNYPDMKIIENSRKKKCREVFRLVYPGTLSPHHGIDIAIRAVSVLKKKIPNIRLDIYSPPGNRQYTLSLNKLCNSLDLREHINFLEPVPFHDIAKVYAIADVGIVPKRKGIFSSEAFSTKILEFMVSGVPLVVSRTKIDEYYFDESMLWFFDPEDHEGLARCVIDILRSPDKARSKVENARKYIQGKTWEAKKELYLSIIKNLKG
jgi:glycosyltransferase involved in cell wall biosynthesis